MKISDKEVANMFLRVMEFHSIGENDVIRLISSHDELSKKLQVLQQAHNELKEKLKFIEWKGNVNIMESVL
jgi:hypothetical protein